MDARLLNVILFFSFSSSIVLHLNEKGMGTWER